MSVAGNPHHQDHPAAVKKPFHRRNDSGELDVFEAARYFSGYNNDVNNATSFPHQKIVKEDHRSWPRGGRISLDMPIRHVLNNHHNHHHQTVMIRGATMDDDDDDDLHHHHHHHHKQAVKDKKYKQPSSPGGRLASFLNSLFSQSASKKNKKYSSTTSKASSIKDDQDESPGSGRRKRRSSISHFRTSNAAASATGPYSSTTTSGFRTPPAYAQTPTKSYKLDFKSFVAKQNNNIAVKATDDHHDRDHKDLAQKKEEVDKSSVVVGDQNSQKPKLGLFMTTTRFDHDHRDRDDHDHDDDGADSDSSSDLFELPNYELGGCYSSSGLPVYETTNMDNIKRGPPISSA